MIIQKKVGLALGGGFIRALTHIGAIEVLEENKIPIDIVSGCSAGAIVAAAYAAGELEHLKNRFLSASAKDFVKVIFEPTLPTKGLLKGDRIREFFNEFYKDRTFKQLDKKLVLTATDLKNRCQAILTEGNVTDAVRACISVPGFFVPIEDGNRILVDGGNFNLIPSKPLYGAGASYVIAVDVSQKPNIITRAIAAIKKKTVKPIKIIDEGYCQKNELKNFNIISLISRAVNISTTTINNLYHYNYQYDILIKPEVFGVSRTAIKNMKECVEAGRQAAAAALPKIKEDLGL